jgi:predicted Rossmann fold flavoprotein
LRSNSIAVIGGGPAGLMAAETLAAANVRVDLYDAMPSVGRKFLLAGRGGLNLTHGEPQPAFLSRYREHAPWVASWLADFGPQALRDWAQGLGVDTFVGTSGRVFPATMKAAPLLRAWLHRLREQGVRIHARHRWTGWDESGQLRFSTPSGEARVGADAVILALGGGSWSRLGSDGAWAPILAEKGVDEIVCISVNDPFIMKIWGEQTGANDAGITMLSDGNAELTRAIGMNFSAEPVGFVDRSRRYAMLVEDGTVTRLHKEESPGTCEISGGEAMLAAI